MTRLFLAAWLPPEAEDQVRETCALHHAPLSGLRLAPPENWHVTLRFLGEADVDDVVARLNGCTWPAATATIGSTLEVLGGHSVVLPVWGVDDLARAVAATAGSPLDSFHGHVTVARTIGRHRVAAVVSQSSGATCSFDVEAVALVSSTLTPDGARYDTVAEFAIRPGGGH